MVCKYPRVIGGPDWINDDRFEIQAKAGAGASRAQMMAMLQNLLEDRFGMKVHRLHFIEERPSAQAADLSGPTMFIAVQEQLGLKLQASKGPVEFLIVDHVEHPTRN